MTSKLRSTTPIREFIFQSLYYEANEAFEMDHRTAANEWLALKYAIIFKLGERKNDSKLAAAAAFVAYRFKQLSRSFKLDLEFKHLETIEIFHALEKFHNTWGDGYGSVPRAVAEARAKEEWDTEVDQRNRIESEWGQGTRSYTQYVDDS